MKQVGPQVLAMMYPTQPEQTQIELALRESQARLASIIASAMDAIITIDGQQRILLFNAAAEQMFGYTSADMLGKSLDVLLPKRYLSSHRAHVSNFGQTGVTNRTMGRLGTLFGRRASGEEFPIEASISQVTVSEGKLYTVILRDVTERYAAEEKLVESEQQLRATFEQAAVGIAHASPEGQFLRVNQKLCEITGYSRAEMLGKTFQELTHPDDLATQIDLHQKVLSGDLKTYTTEKRYLRKDGTPVWASLTVSVVRDLTGEPLYLIKVIEDITARKAAEAALQAKSDEIKNMTQQLWQAAKLATMGELAASIAHELNNPLAILTLRIESLLEEGDPDSPQQRELAVMEQEVERMASLVGNLLQFSRSGQRQISSLDVREELERTLELAHTHLLHRRITVQREYAAQVPLVQADRQQLRQLFLNLVTNASDAMPQGGSLILRIQPQPEGNGVEIEIQDTGIGIRPEDLRQVMEPFYTTKTEGKGTGLGLAICRRIVEEHRGSIRISSQGEGLGTVVKIWLPGNGGSQSKVLEE